MTRPRVSMAAGVCALLLLPACGGGTATTTPSVVASTETFSGTLQPGGTVSHNFTVTVAGTVTIGITALSPQTTVTMGLGIGQFATTCTLLSSAENARVGSSYPVDVTAGAYCVMLYDLGNLTGPNTYTLTVTHT
jgi:hypothetical protein